MLKKCLVSICLLACLPLCAWADTYNYGAGGVAQNIMEPVTLLSNFIGSGSIVIGISSLFASFIKYMQYRVNPIQSPISTVIMLFVMGLVLLLLPLSYKLTSGGIPLGS